MGDWDGRWKIEDGDYEWGLGLGLRGNEGSNSPDSGCSSGILGILCVGETEAMGEDWVEEGGKSKEQQYTCGHKS